ncbi:hypothetical protein Zmor_012619 [Zophobas morio]|uniref:Uncharacterized protein n=1 Tax=Zophobas morio TaxID=2755281 RepID=A0AA38MEW8_9CUCU|nr:hypothetical protein Zmor_012619 [Zophobas morio]
MGPNGRFIIKVKCGFGRNRILASLSRVFFVVFSGARFHSWCPTFIYIMGPRDSVFMSTTALTILDCLIGKKREQLQLSDDLFSLYGVKYLPKSSRNAVS